MLVSHLRVLDKMYLLFVSCLLTGAVSTPAPAHDVEGIKVPIAKRASLARNTGAVDPVWYFGHAQWAIQKYQPDFVWPFNMADVVKRAR